MRNYCLAVNLPMKQHRSENTDSRQLILKSARAEIEKNGILGLRVADVAANANYSISVIYRHFGDRDGLLAQVLGDLYEEILDQTSKRTADLIPPEGPLTVDQILALAPKPSEVHEWSVPRLRLQILAVAANNRILEDRLKSIAQRRYAGMLELAEVLKSRLPEGTVFDERVFTIMIVNQLLYYNTLLGDLAISDSEYYDFLKSKATCR
jgi:AcrR family transcriptional regulator